MKREFCAKRRNDLILAAGIVLVSLLGAVLLSVSGEDGAYAVVYENGEMTAQYPLFENTEILIQDTNRLMIRDGRADMTAADCPDQLCVKQRAIRKKGESITCLPNRVTVVIEGGEEEGLDAVVY